MRDGKSLMAHKKPGYFALFTSLAACAVLLFILAPLTGMIASSSLPGLFDAARDREVGRSIMLTLWVSFAATLLFAIPAIPFAYLLARKNFPLKSLVLAVVNIPVVIPHTAAGIALLGVISRNTLPGKLAEMAGLSFVGSPAGIGIAMAFVSIPFLINAAREGFLSVSEKLEKSASLLGAGPARVFFTVSLPLAWRGILSGMVLMFARGLSEFGAVVIIAYHPMTTPVMIFERFGTFGLAYARPVAVLFILVVLMFFVLLRLLSGKGKYA